MACSNCASGGSGCGTLPAGCKNNGSCGSGGCNTLTVFDWLAGMELASGRKQFDIVEVRFKGTRKEFYRSSNLDLSVGDAIAVESHSGHDIGIVSLSGELVRVQMQRKNLDPNARDIRKVYRKAREADIEAWRAAQELEKPTMFKARQLSAEHGLQMKISDVEFQGDGTKATFFYTADERVDFRELIKALAAEFQVRIDMRQIGARQEAGRLGGIGSCGRELCCSTWLTDFRSVSTSAARYQQLAINPMKLAGQCGKLKCCLNYELDTYLEAIKEFPKNDVKLRTEKGTAFHQKTDIFSRTLWYSYENEPANFIPLDLDHVLEIIAMNKDGKKPHDLKDYVTIEIEEEPDYENVVGQDSLTRFDGQRKGRRKKRPGGRGGKSQGNRNPEAKTQGGDGKKSSGGRGRGRGRGPQNKSNSGGGQKSGGNQNSGAQGANKQGAKPAASKQGGDGAAKSNSSRNRSRGRGRGPRKPSSNSDS